MIQRIKNWWLNLWWCRILKWHKWTSNCAKGIPPTEEQTGNVKNLYNDVDMVLRNNSVQPGAINANVQVATVAHALQKMLKTQRYFDVCTIDKCAELCQVCIPKERMLVYRTVHCVDWNEMLPDYRQLVVAMVLDDFRMVLCPK